MSGGGRDCAGGRGVEGWCGGTGRHSVGKARHRHGKARHRHGMARECHGGGTADGVPRTFQNNLPLSVLPVRFGIPIITIISAQEEISKMKLIKLSVLWVPAGCSAVDTDNILGAVCL